MEKKNIAQLLEEFNSGLDGVGPILWHKKPHKNESGDFACVKGVVEGCSSAINCPNCYSDKTGGYCLSSGGENVSGFLAVEYKHERFVCEGKDGAYSSIKEAMNHFNH